MYVNINRANNVIYKLYYNNEFFNIDEDIDWSKSDLSFDRDMKYSGINYNTSNNIVFFGDTALILKGIYYNGIDEIAILVKSSPDNEDVFIGSFDFSTFDFNDGRVSIKMSDKGYINIIQTNFDKNINITNEDLNGKSLEPLSLVDLMLYSRGIHRVTKLVNDDDRGLWVYRNNVASGGYNHNPMYINEDHTEEFIHSVPTRMNDSQLNGARNFSVRLDCLDDGLDKNIEVRGLLPFNLIKKDSNDYNTYNQNSEILIRQDDFDNLWGDCMWYVSPAGESIGNTFVSNSNDVDIIVKTNISLELNFKYKAFVFEYYNSVRVSFRILLSKYKYNYSDEEMLTKVEDSIILKEHRIWFNGGDEKLIDLSIETTKNLKLSKNEAYSLEYSVIIDKAINSSNGDYYNYSHVYESSDFFIVKSLKDGIWQGGLRPEKVEINISRIEKQRPSNHKVFTLKDVVYRYLNLIGIYNIKSDVLNKEYKDYILTNGFMLRGFPLLDEDNKNKNIVLSNKDLIDSIMYIFGLGFGVEKINGIETVVIEKRGYFYSNNVLDLTTTNFKVTGIKPLIELYYNSIVVGYQAPTEGSYGSEFGLDEFNMGIEYGTEIKTKVNSLILKSKLRADSLGIESVRLEKYDENNKKDTRYDESLFIIDCKKEKGFYTPKTYKDFSNRPPRNVIDGIGVYNLAITPKDILLNNLNFLKSGLKNGVLKVSSMSSPIDLHYNKDDYEFVQGDDIDFNIADRLFKAELITIKTDLTNIDFKKDYKRLLKFSDEVIGYIHSINYKESTITILKK